MAGTTREPARRQVISGPVLWTGLTVGTFAATEALVHRVNLVPLLSGALGILVTCLLVIVAGVVLAELARRHHRTVAAHGWRHGKRAAAAAGRHGWRGVSAAARHARRHGGTALRRVAAKVTARRENREHDAADQERYEQGRRLFGPDGPPPVSGTPPLPQKGTTTMPSRIDPARRARRNAARNGGTIPSEWGPVIAQTADFEPESDAHLVDWMARQVNGLSGWAEALVDFYEHCTQVIGIDPKASTMLHDVADAAAQAAETMGAAKARFTEHYELPREFAANGGLMTHDGRWVTGEGA